MSPHGDSPARGRLRKQVVSFGLARFTCPKVGGQEGSVKSKHLIIFHGLCLI